MSLLHAPARGIMGASKMTTRATMPGCARLNIVDESASRMSFSKHTIRANSLQE